MDEPKDPVLQPGIYRIYWNDGGMSVAAIGVDEFGKNWVAPTNWLRPFHQANQYKLWEGIYRVELITTQNDQMLAHNQELHHRLTRDKAGINYRHYDHQFWHVVAPTEE